MIKSLINLDYSQIYSVISQDLVSADDEIQLNTMKILYQMPPKLALEIIQTNQKDFLKILKNQEFHYERLACLHDFLIKAYIKNYTMELKEDCAEQIIELYLKISESVFSPNRDISRNSLEIFLNLYREYLENCTDFNSVDLYYDGNGDVKIIMKPLIVKLTNYFMPKLEYILGKIHSYEIYLRNHLLTFLVLQLDIILDLLEESGFGSLDQIRSPFVFSSYHVKTKNGEEINLQVFYENLLDNLMLKQLIRDDTDSDYLQTAYQNIFYMLALSQKHPSLLVYHKKCEIVYELFDNFYHLIRKSNFKHDLNQILINILI